MNVIHHITKQRYSYDEGMMNIQSIVGVVFEMITIASTSVSIDLLPNSTHQRGGHEYERERG
jgi:hypothetical protein